MLALRQAEIILFVIRQVRYTLEEEKSTDLPLGPQGRWEPGRMVVCEEVPWLVFGNPGVIVGECQ